MTIAEDVCACYREALKMAVCEEDVKDVLWGTNTKASIKACAALGAYCSSVVTAQNIAGFFCFGMLITLQVIDTSRPRQDISELQHASRCEGTYR
ncbi:hypothetical protein E2562_026693 [Oryza meyeriana var. granulata]|uniref:Uncharacterized protein n=1 Tax=Oryza meyeriana var. granulata TaxID=110450 RepID=A0A6G1E238_9ORYZ|nr:hypothetical protein E2562_026693 [Oryza meyeriana var. granulata]